MRVISLPIEDETTEAEVSYCENKSSDVKKDFLFKSYDYYCYAKTMGTRGLLGNYSAVNNNCYGPFFQRRQF
jgi:hypothetical protein